MDQEALVILTLMQILKSVQQQRSTISMIVRLLRRRRLMRFLRSIQLQNVAYLDALKTLVVRQLSVRRFWSLPRPQQWFDMLLSRRDLDFWWKEHFRINRNTFMAISDLVRPYMTTENNNFRLAVPVEKKVAAA